LSHCLNLGVKLNSCFSCSSLWNTSLKLKKLTETPQCELFELENSHRNLPKNTYLPSKLTSPAKDGFTLIKDKISHKPWRIQNILILCVVVVCRCKLNQIIQVIVVPRLFFERVIWWITSWAIRALFVVPWPGTKLLWRGPTKSSG